MPIRTAGQRTYSNHGLGVSPTATFHTPAASFPHSMGSIAVEEGKQLKPFETTDIKILLLENVNQSGRDILTEQGYQVEFLKSSLPEDELIEKIRSAFISSPPPPSPRYTS